MAATKLFTVEDLATLDSLPERCELIEGAVVGESPSGGEHAYIASRLHGHLFVFCEGRIDCELFIADGGFVLGRNPDTLIAPDVALAMAERLKDVERPQGAIPIAPDLAVEVKSPTNTTAELIRKVGLYLAGGTKLVWLVRPVEQTVTVFQSDAAERVLGFDDTLDGGELLPGFALPLNVLFRPMAGIRR